MVGLGILDRLKLGAGAALGALVASGSASILRQI
jgi:hypothetical protein